jgi:hypothetical protein
MDPSSSFAIFPRGWSVRIGKFKARRRGDLAEPIVEEG